MVRPEEEAESLLQEYADLIAIAIAGGETFKARAHEEAARGRLRWCPGAAWSAWSPSTACSGSRPGGFRTRGRGRRLP
ncbi:hypothetical protein ADK41_21015 [Streptomyces caelestis]|uniref:Uncharacterized protein n=1 Tax=Streptomyces caelestis TaxID=36816 RepID=A0A0N0S5X8_9ACTN|nr:hypothetical protein ADK41_21015 [Streptomyces caelestis]